MMRRRRRKKRLDEEEKIGFYCSIRVSLVQFLVLKKLLMLGQARQKKEGFTLIMRRMRRRKTGLIKDVDDETNYDVTKIMKMMILMMH